MPDAVDPLVAKVAAAETTATTNAACTALGPFYWEIGDAAGPLASGSIGGMYGASSVLNIASASKLMWGAYVVERAPNDLAAATMGLTMRSGYTNFTSCIGAVTVESCFLRGDNNQLTIANEGRFFYNGGHFQKQAIGFGLGADTDAELAAEVKRLLGSELDFTYVVPQPAQGVTTTPATYATFLRKVLSHSLALADHLGDGAVCTLPGAACPNAVSSPVPEAWHYSYGHWVEDDPATGDGAFSSPGMFGFYPWIDATKTYYGVLARQDMDTGDQTAGGGKAYWASVECGRLIRKAFVTSAAQ